MARPTRAELEARVRSLERAARRREKLLGALRASEERYRALIERSDDLILTCRLDGTITEINAGNGHALLAHAGGGGEKRSAMTRH